MYYIGAHVSAAGGLENAVSRALQINADAFALFTKNQKQWKSSALTTAQIEAFKNAMRKGNFSPSQVLTHDSYLINLGNGDDQKRRKSTDAFIDEMRRVQQLGLDRLNFHPGAHLREIEENYSMQLVAEGIDEALEETEGVYAVIETTAGQGSSLGKSFEQIAYIIDKVRHKERVGVCIDTCHIFAAGYDLRTSGQFLEVMEMFDSLIGSDMLMGMHLNDAKSEFNSRVDRHAPLGDGNIGLECFRSIMNDARFENIPLILETPAPERWSDEIAMLRGFVQTS
ncbi:MAG: deoxyribonuclease IV [Sphaerochaetaceae bacterium]|nr:deoxyribonuclease IV [Sphaerochaetaceae bacterium]